MQAFAVYLVLLALGGCQVWASNDEVVAELPTTNIPATKLSVKEGPGSVVPSSLLTSIECGPTHACFREFYEMVYRDGVRSKRVYQVVITICECPVGFNCFFYHDDISKRSFEYRCKPVSDTPEDKLDLDEAVAQLQTTNIPATKLSFKEGPSSVVPSSLLTRIECGPTHICYWEFYEMVYRDGVLGKRVYERFKICDCADGFGCYFHHDDVSKRTFQYRCKVLRGAPEANLARVIAHLKDAAFTELQINKVPSTKLSFKERPVSVVPVSLLTRPLCDSTHVCFWEFYEIEIIDGEPYRRVDEGFKTVCDCPHGFGCYFFHDDKSRRSYEYRCQPAPGFIEVRSPVEMFIQ